MTSADDPLKSSVENVVIYDSIGWGISVKNSQNISLKNVNVFKTTQIGVSIDGSTNISADGVNVYGVQRRPITFYDNVVDKECCFAFGTYFGFGVTTSSVINSRVGGCPYAGFLAPAYGCADPVGASTTNVFKNNVAHSVDGSGAAIVPDPKQATHKTCHQGSHFAAYKVSQGGIGTMQTSDEVRFSNIISVDNTLGLAINLSGETDKEKLITLQNSFIYGENTDIAKDCPDGVGGSATGANCYCAAKMGHMNSSFVRKDKDPHNPSASARPVHKIKSYHTWNGKAITKNTTFKNFKSELTACGQQQSLFGINYSASDLIPIHEFHNVNFMNVKYNAVAYIYDPPQSWAVIDDCGEWPCTAPSNVVYNFYNSMFG